MFISVTSAISRKSNNFPKRSNMKRQDDYHYIDTKEAPDDFYPVTKYEFLRGGNKANVCVNCDWRKDCQTMSTVSDKQNCMPYARKDGVSVVFKKIPESGICPVCNGSGFDPQGHGISSCYLCNGSGKLSRI